MKVKIIQDVPAKGLVKGDEVEVRDDAARHLIARKQAKEVKTAEPEAVAAATPPPKVVQTSADLPTADATGKVKPEAKAEAPKA